MQMEDTAEIEEDINPLEPNGKLTLFGTLTYYLF